MLKRLYKFNLVDASDEPFEIHICITDSFNSIPGLQNIKRLVCKASQLKPLEHTLRNRWYQHYSLKRNRIAAVHALIDEATVCDKLLDSFIVLPRNRKNYVELTPSSLCPTKQDISNHPTHLKFILN